MAISKLLWKIFRYTITLYPLHRHKIIEAVRRPNIFTPSTIHPLDNERIVVYTAITGDYDQILEPMDVRDNLEYYVITNNDVPRDSVWNKIEPPEKISRLSYLEKARYLKLHPHELFPDCRYSIWIDGNVSPLKDLSILVASMVVSEKFIAIHRHPCRDCLYDEAKMVYILGKAGFKEIYNQVKFYKKQDFPKHFGLFETNIIIRDHNNSECIKLMEKWWEQIKEFTKRDQLSLTYAMWQLGMSVDDVFSLGTNSRNSEWFRVGNHK